MLSKKKYNPHQAWCDAMVGSDKRSYISYRDVAPVTRKQKKKGLKLSGESKAVLARQLSTLFTAN